MLLKTLLVTVTLVGWLLPHSAAGIVECGLTVGPGHVVNDTWTLADSPVCVNGDIQVSLLTIEPGVEVNVEGDYEIEILSNFSAVGTPLEPIVFKAADPALRWGGLLMQHLPPGSVEMQWCTVRDSNDSGIRIINSAPLIADCTLRGNTALNGGGLNVRMDSLPAQTLTLTRCRVLDNVSSSSGSGGGGIFASTPTGSLDLLDCVVADNRAGETNAHGTRYGGGLYVTGSVGLVNSVVAGNTANSWHSQTSGYPVIYSVGGGIYTNGTLTLDACAISGNHVYASTPATFGSGYAYGSGVYAAGGPTNFTNTVVSSNMSTAKKNGAPPENRSAVHLSTDVTGSLMNTTIIDNDKVALAGDLDDVVVMNSILYFNNAGGVQVPVDGVDITYSDVQNGHVGEGNIDFQPVAIESCDWAITYGSPCIDAGHPAAQYNDDPACAWSLLGPRNDMGAHGGPGAMLWGSSPYWVDEGQAMESPSGVPRLTGRGTLLAYSPATVLLSGARPNSPVVIIVGWNSANAPLLGGTLVPFPDYLLFGTATDSTGERKLCTMFPAGFPEGEALHFQFWIDDPDGPFGWTASNGMMVVAP